MAEIQTVLVRLTAESAKFSQAMRDGASAMDRLFEWFWQRMSWRERASFTIRHPLTAARKWRRRTMLKGN